jgi:hypothetical protein
MTSTTAAAGRPVELFVEDSATDDSDRWDR